MRPLGPAPVSHSLKGFPIASRLPQDVERTGTGLVNETLKGDRPRSAVGNATGLAGLAGMVLAALLMAGSMLGPIERSLILMAAAALPMILWAVLVEKVHRNPTTGLDFAAPRPAQETLETTKTKLLGLWATWLAIFALYFAARPYGEAQYAAYFALMGVAFGPLFLLSIPYVYLVDRYMTDPKDGLWHMGKWVSGDWRAVDRELLADHFRCWAIKAFFLAFMFSVFPGMVARLMETPVEWTGWDPVTFVPSAFIAILIVDVCFGTIGYVVTCRPLDAHIRTANPYMAGWVAALVCYPPFLLMAPDGPLDYRVGGAEWSDWFAGDMALLTVWAALLIALSAFYAWATVIFGLRFSNLTHRGIITDGPYRWFKHPAYLSKNLFWWLMYLPFLSPDGGVEALRNCLLILAVNAIYFARARTEERHLMEDADYRAYAAWIAEHGVLPRLRRRLGCVLPARPAPGDTVRRARSP